MGAPRASSPRPAARKQRLCGRDARAPRAQPCHCKPIKGEMDPLTAIHA